MRRGIRLGSPCAAILFAALAGDATAQDCDICEDTVTLSPAQAECFLAEVETYRRESEIASPVLVAFGTCSDQDVGLRASASAEGEALRGEAEFLVQDERDGEPGCTGAECPPPARYGFLSAAQIDCLASRLRAGAVAETDRTIDLRTCP